MASKKIIIPLDSDSEADTCRKEVTPKLYASEWTEILDCRFAYATNGTEILEYDFITGLETAIAQYPTP